MKTINGKLLVFALFVLVIVVPLAWKAWVGEGTELWSDRKQKISELEEELKVLGKRITAAGSNHCESGKDCRLIGLGAKICDKYAGFFVYSSRFTDGEKLLKLVSQFNVASERLNALAYRVPSCGIDPAPVDCIRKTCTVLGQ